ncbi:MAG: TolC family outer membrane protein [Paracoccaceae bacterium]|jgi:outer membrane protein
MVKALNYRGIRKIVLTAGLMMTTALPTFADNLTDAMIGAYKTSGLLEQQRAVLRAADEDVAIALAGLRPVVNWITRFQQSFRDVEISGVTTNTDTSTLFTGIRLQQLVYDGGATRLSQEAAQETVLATRQVLLAVEQQILLRAVRAYANVLLQQENVALRRNNLRLLQEELSATQDRFEVGEVTRTDVALAESRVAAAKANLTDARGALIDARAEYVNAVGNDPGTVAEQPNLPSRPANIGAARSVALRNHPDILADQHRVRASELDLQAAGKTLGPNAALQADLGLSNLNGDTDSATEDFTVQLTVTQPLYAGGALAAGVRKAQAGRDATRSGLIITQRDIAQGVSNAFVALEVSRANLISTAEQIRAAQVAFDGIREEAALGARTTLDVLEAEQDLLDAQTARLNAAATEIVAAYALLSSQGLLSAERLGLAVQIYDPTLYYNLVKDAPAYQSKQSKDLNRVLEALGKK